MRCLHRLPLPPPQGRAADHRQPPVPAAGPEVLRCQMHYDDVLLWRMLSMCSGNANTAVGRASAHGVHGSLHAALLECMRLGVDVFVRMALW